MLNRRYENLVQVRCLLEGMAPDEMLQNWGTILPQYMQKWGLDRAEVRGFRFFLFLSVKLVLLLSCICVNGE